MMRVDQNAEVEDLKHDIDRHLTIISEQQAEIERLRSALKPFAEIGGNLYRANQSSDQSTLISASARFLKLEPLTGQSFVDAFTAFDSQQKAGDQ